MATLIPTLQSVRLQRRHIDRRRTRAAHVLSAMSHGAALHQQFTSQGKVFTLTGGRSVTPDVAAVVIGHSNVVSVNDGLFAGTPQTWRWAEA
jgi:hypothetical protein